MSTIVPAATRARWRRTWRERLVAGLAATAGVVGGTAVLAAGQGGSPSAGPDGTGEATATTSATATTPATTTATTSATATSAAPATSATTTTAASRASRTPSSRSGGS